MKFLGGERKFVPAFEELARAIAWDGRVAAENDAVHSDLTHSLGQQRGALFPHSGDGNARCVKIKTPYAGISAFDRLRIDAERLVDRAVVASPSGQMRDLNCDVRRCRKQTFEENPRLLRPVRPIVI